MADKTKTETADAPVTQNAGAEAKPKKEYRTKGKAGDTLEIPAWLPVITNRKYQNALSFIPNDAACLRLVSAGNNLKYKNGQLFLKGFPATRKQMEGLCTDKGIEKIPILLLMAIYAAVLHKFSPSCQQGPHVDEKMEIFYPDLARKLTTNAGRGNREAFEKNMKLLGNVYGIINGGAGQGDILPALDSFKMDERKNTFSFKCPYIKRVIWEIHNDSIRRNRKGEALLKKNGDPQTLPAYSFLANISMAGEKNRKAVEIVVAVVALVEQAGNNVPHIRAKTLVERCPGLNASLKGKPASTATLYLKRAFTKAWDLLKEETSIGEAYKDIDLPDPKDPKFIPTKSTLDTVFQFPHGGKGGHPVADPSSA